MLPLLGKRGLGMLSWHLRRRHAHRSEVLDALLRDLEHVRPDHVVVTGDLTNLSLPGEFEAARHWLTRLGPPARVTAVPGNHDAYVPIAEARSWALWSDYLVSDTAGHELLAELGGVTKEGAITFPSVRFLGELALIGLCSARPTLPLLASGALGTAQREQLEALLAELGSRGHARIVLLHHPPAPDAVAPRRALDDAEALCALLHRVGAELVLHGHAHRTRIGSLPGPGGPIPVVGVRSSSNADPRPERLARYHTYTVDGGAGALRIQLRERAYDPATDAFQESGPPEGTPLPLP